MKFVQLKVSGSKMAPSMAVFCMNHKNTYKKNIQKSSSLEPCFGSDALNMVCSKKHYQVCLNYGIRLQNGPPQGVLDLNRRNTKKKIFKNLFLQNH